MFKSISIWNIMNYSEKKEIDPNSLREIAKYEKVVLKTQQIFKSEGLNVFTEEISKIASLNDDKKMQSTDSIETYVHGMRKNICTKNINCIWWYDCWCAS